MKTKIVLNSKGININESVRVYQNMNDDKNKSK